MAALFISYGFCFLCFCCGQGLIEPFLCCCPRVVHPGTRELYAHLTSNRLPWRRVGSALVRPRAVRRRTCYFGTEDIMFHVCFLLNAISVDANNNEKKIAIILVSLMFAERIPFFWARRDHARLLVCAPKRHKTQTHRKFTPRWGFTGNGAPWRTARWEPLLLTQGAHARPWSTPLPGKPTSWCTRTWGK